jgi:hypothetical protein
MENKSNINIKMDDKEKNVPINNKEQLSEEKNSDNNNNNRIIRRNFSLIKNKLGNIGSSLKKDVGDVISKVTHPKETIQKIIKVLKIIPYMLGSLIKGDKFLEEVKNVSLILAKALQESIEIITPEIEESVSKLVTKVSNSTFLAILDGVGVIPGVGEILDLILLAHNILRAIISVTNVSVEITDITSNFINNLIRIYKKTSREVESSENRITESVDTFNKTTNTPLTNRNDSSKQNGGYKKKYKSKTKRKYK